MQTTYKVNQSRPNKQTPKKKKSTWKRFKEFFTGSETKCGFAKHKYKQEEKERHIGTGLFISGLEITTIKKYKLFTCIKCKDQVEI